MAEEVELTLRVASNDPEEVFRDIAARRSLGSWSLMPQSSLSMHDAYLDTPGETLKNGGYALRVRTQGDRTLLALKGRERINEWGEIRRLEIEGPWSEETLGQVDRELGTGLVRLHAFREDDPLKSLQVMGFLVIQSRETTRTLLDVTTQPEGERICEMALDRVCYAAAGRGYLHYEIEVEAKKQGGQGLLQEIGDCLHRAYPGLLKQWDHNKLITGFALEAIIRLGELAQAPGYGPLIPLSWYDEMDAWIRRQKPRA